MNKKIFVYGSLLENFYNYNKYLALKVEKMNYGKVLGKLYHLKNKGYPAMIRGNDFIYGEIFELYDWERTVARLDELEGYFGDGNSDNMYNKTLIEVEVLPGKSKELAYVYMYNCKDELELSKEIYLPEGNWRNFMEKSNK
ncbi:MAG: gamma-glutamylcyclotransferase family protein [Clostridium sp.]|uniref:gamma-glutamylcyclotransferase family protein n=1 Tax=Clostridium sp. TaxID=1506 RepID=UPI003D6CE1E2